MGFFGSLPQLFFFKFGYGVIILILLNLLRHFLSFYEVILTGDLVFASWKLAKTHPENFSETKWTITSISYKV